MTVRLFQRLIGTILCLSLLPFNAQAAVVQPVLKSGDELELTILTSNDSLAGYSQRVVLADDGVVTLPLIGRLAWLGKTPEQIVPELEKAYRRIFAYAFIGLQFVRSKPADAPPSEVVFISGQVKGGGVIPPSQAGIRLNMTELIGRAGGLTDQADAEHITIFRVGGGVETVNFDKGLQDGSAARVILQPGDTVRVPGNWQAFISTYMPLVQVLSLVGGAALVIGGLILNGQASARQAPVTP